MLCSRSYFNSVKEAIRLNKERIAELKEEIERFNALKVDLNAEKDKAKNNLPHDVNWAAKVCAAILRVI